MDCSRQYVLRCALSRMFLGGLGRRAHFCRLTVVFVILRQHFSRPSADVAKPLSACLIVVVVPAGVDQNLYDHRGYPTFSVFPHSLPQLAQCDVEHR